MSAPPASPPRVVVIGAGAAGLAAARRLTQAGLHVTVLENEKHTGGRMWTEAVDGFRIDAGAGFFATFYSRTLELIDALNLTSDLVPIRGSGSVLRDGTVHELPRGPRLAGTPLLSSRSKLVLLRVLPPLLRNWRSLDPHAFHEAHRLDTASITAYARRHLNEEILEKLIQPALAGIFYGTPERTSQAMLFMLLKVGMRLHRVTLTEGVGQLADALAATADVVLDARVTRVRAGDRSRYTVTAQVGGAERAYEADGVVCTVPAPLVPAIFPDLTPRQQGFFASIQYTSTVIAALALGTHPLRGRESILIPRTAAGVQALAAVTSLSAKNPRQVSAGQELLRLFASGPVSTALLGQSNDEIRDLLTADLRRTGIADLRPADELFHRIYRWEHALPEFGVGHFVRLRAFANGEIESGKVVFAGDYLGGPLVEGAITSGVAAAERLMGRLGWKGAGSGVESRRQQPRDANGSTRP